MLSSERPPPCSSKIVSPESDEAADPADDGVDETQQTPHFCIRSYVLSSRGEGIGNHWPFSEQYLRLCLKHGVRNLLPPFEPPDLVRARCSRTRLEGEATQKVAGATPAVDGGADEEEPVRRDAPAEVEPSKATDTMAFFKVCPVCKGFSSPSNTTLNAHIDQCLVAAGGAAVASGGGAGIPRMKVKPKKKRSMAEILASAPSSTLEDLDRRNGTSWSVDLALIRSPAELPPPPVTAGERPVYVEPDGTKVRILSKLGEAAPAAAAAAAAPQLDFDFSPRKRLRLELRDARSRFPGEEAGSPLKHWRSSKGKVHGRKRRSFLRRTGKILQAMGGELKEEISLTAQEQIKRRWAMSKRSDLSSRSNGRLIRTSAELPSPANWVAGDEGDRPASSPEEEQQQEQQQLPGSTTRGLRLRLLRSSETAGGGAGTRRRRRSAARNSAKSSRRYASDRETPSPLNEEEDGEAAAAAAAAAAPADDADGNGGNDGDALVEVSAVQMESVGRSSSYSAATGDCDYSGVATSEEEEEEDAGVLEFSGVGATQQVAGEMEANGERSSEIPRRSPADDSVLVQIDCPCLISTEDNVLELPEDFTVAPPSPASLSSTLSNPTLQEPPPEPPAAAAAAACSGDRGLHLGISQDASSRKLSESQFARESFMAAPPSNQAEVCTRPPDQPRRNPVLRLMGKNLMVMSRKEEGEEDGERGRRPESSVVVTSTTNHPPSLLGFSSAYQFSNGSDFLDGHFAGERMPASRQPSAPPPPPAGERSPFVLQRMSEEGGNPSVYSLRPGHGYRAPAPASEVIVVDDYPEAVSQLSGNFPAPANFPATHSFFSGVDRGRLAGVGYYSCFPSELRPGFPASCPREIGAAARWIAGDSEAPSSPFVPSLSAGHLGTPMPYSPMFW